MNYYEVWVADNRYRGDKPLTYSIDRGLEPLTPVTITLRGRNVTGFIAKVAKRPTFKTQPIKSVLSSTPLPDHCLKLAQWLSTYYGCSLGEALRLFAPATTTVRRGRPLEATLATQDQLEINSTLTSEQQKAIDFIAPKKGRSVLLHGETGSGKTRVYLELAAKTLSEGKSCFLLTPEISLTPQLVTASEQFLSSPIYVIHSGLAVAERKKIWFEVLESKAPLTVIGPRSALFMPVAQVGLVILDEFHEPAYKQEQSLRYYAPRVASALGSIANANVVLGSATPPVLDYYVAESKQSLVRMERQAISGKKAANDYRVIDIKNRDNFKRNPYLSDSLLDAINTTLLAKKQIIIYLNRRGTARLLLCKVCGWQLMCPNCDIPLVYHADSHQACCHSCGFKQQPPVNCPVCANPDIQYKSVGTKAIAESLASLFPQVRVQRFDSDNADGESLSSLYKQIKTGNVDILVGTQILAKGLDLPRLGLVGIIAAETSLSLPDYTAEERSFQLLYQIMGRVNRGHTKGQVVVQAYRPDSFFIKAAGERQTSEFYKRMLEERKKYSFPPYSYLMKLECRKTTPEQAQAAAIKLAAAFTEQKLPIQILGPAPSFYARRGRLYGYQLVIKAKHRRPLLQLAGQVPNGWKVDLDPINLL